MPQPIAFPALFMKQTGNEIPTLPLFQKHTSCSWYYTFQGPPLTPVFDCF